MAKKERTWAQLESLKNSTRERYEEEVRKLDEEENELFEKTKNRAKDILDAARVNAFSVLTTGMTAEHAEEALNEILGELYRGQ